MFARFGNVNAVKIINDRAGIPRGYGFVTFDSEEEAKRVLREGDNLVLKGRKLNVAIAVKKQPIGRVGQYLYLSRILMLLQHHPFPFICPQMCSSCKTSTCIIVELNLRVRQVSNSNFVRTSITEKDVVHSDFLLRQLEGNFVMQVHYLKVLLQKNLEVSRLDFIIEIIFILL